MNDYEAEDFSPTASLLSSVPASAKSNSSRYSARRAYSHFRVRCHRIKVRIHDTFHSRYYEHQHDTTCEVFDFPYPSPLTFNFSAIQYEAAPPTSNEDDDWYTTLGTSLRRGYQQYDTFA